MENVNINFNVSQLPGLDRNRILVATKKNNDIDLIMETFKDTYQVGDKIDLDIGKFYCYIVIENNNPKDFYDSVINLDLDDKVMFNFQCVNSQYQDIVNDVIKGVSV